MARVAVLLFPLALASAQDGVVFRSEVSLVRVDAQVVDGSGHAISGLQAGDFVLREEGRPQPIRNFAREDMPVDVLLLLDVSGSMRSHVERIAAASRQALVALGGEDRVAVMVFDRSARLELPFARSRSEVERQLHAILRQETFDGGTDITRALVDAAGYVAREARREARRAIVILTDDQTERERDEARVSRALTSADAVLSALLAPDAMRRRGAWPGAGGPWGGVILGRRRPGPVVTAPRTRPAGTAEIARQSGGDSLRVDEASALESTLARIRQRYALHFHLPEDAPAGQQRSVEVELTEAARRLHPGAEVRYRRAYYTPSVLANARPPESEGWRRVEDTQEAPSGGGWRRLKPGEAP